MLFNALHQIPDFELRRDDVYMCAPALCWAAGFHDITLALWLLGGKVVLPESTGFDADEFCRQMAAERTTRRWPR